MNHSESTHVHEEGKNFAEVPSLAYSLLSGGLGFGVVSLVVFATVAFGERWMYTNLGVVGAYLAWTALFIVLGGTVLGSLVVGRWQLPKFYLLFGLAFFAYAAGWVVAYSPFVVSWVNGSVRLRARS